MKPCIVGTVVWFSCWLCILSLQAKSPEIEAAREHGAKGKVTFRIIDSKGKPVENANVNVAFSHSDSHVNDDVFDKPTDTNGLCMVSGISVDQMNFTITKPRHYKTEGQYWFYPGAGRSIDNGRWQPWNPTNTVTLKERSNPVPMYANNVEMPVPIRDVPVGFDLEIGDWVAPHGKGKESDLLLTYKAKVQDYWNGSLELAISCTNKLDGVFRAQKDMGSDFHSVYKAPSGGYQSEIKFAFVTTTDKDLKVEKLGDTEYLIFRVRTVLDDKGNIVSARYGKIYGPIEFGVGKEHCVRFTYYFNPTANDRNLEFDLSRNLMWQAAGKRVSMP